MTVYDVMPFSDHEKANPKDVTNTNNHLSKYNISKHDDSDQMCALLKSLDILRDPSSLPCRHDNAEYTRECTSVSRLVYSQDEDGDTLLHSAIIMLDENIAGIFINLTQSFELLNIKNRLRQTPLHLAVLTNQVRIVRRLVVGGADVMTRDREGYTSLHIACRDGHTDIVRTLLEPVRYIETKENEYDIPYQKIPQDLEKTNYDGVSCLHIAASNGHLEIVKLLLEKFADINCKDKKSGRTPLHHACVHGNVELVQLLLTYKTCNINARTYDNLTPFDLARDRGHARITLELALAGARAADEIDMEVII